MPKTSNKNPVLQYRNKTNFNQNAVKPTAKTEAIKKCGKAYILADKSKFDENSFITFCKMEDVIIITDKEECEKYKTEIFKIK